MEDLHDALSSHGISLFVDSLHIPKGLLLVLIIWTHNDGHNVQLKPEPRAKGWAHVLERRGETSTDEL